MTITDPIADMLTRIRNVAMTNQSLVSMPSSNLKVEIARILKEEGYIDSYEVVEGKVAGQPVLRLRLKYIGERRHRRPIITGLQRVSRPGCRVYTARRISPGCFLVSGSPFCPPLKGL